MNTVVIPEGLADVRSRHFLPDRCGWIAFAVEDVLAAAGAAGLTCLRARGGQDVLLAMPVRRGPRAGRVMAPLPPPPLPLVYVPRDALPDPAMAGPPR